MNKAIFVLPFILLSLLTAIYTGWWRMGWSLPVGNAGAQHGAIMVNSFLATLIFLERAVTFKNKWILLLPLINGLSVVFFLTGLASVAQLLLILGSFGFTVLCGYFIYRYQELYYYIFFAGAFCLLSGNIILFKTHFYPYCINWWMAFLLLTIVAERIELSRFLALTNVKRNWLLTALGGVMLTLFLPFHFYGKYFFAFFLMATAFWLLKYDMARHSVRIKGQHRYSGTLLIVGYVWLFITAVLLLFGNQIVFSYDAALHSFFIGFVFSMIFSHAPVILPAVLKLPVKLYRPVLYGWFVLLQASLLVRIVADVLQDVYCRKLAGMVNGITILLFFATIAFTIRLELVTQQSLRLSKT